MNRYNNAFISYSNPDKDFVENIVSLLQEKGLKVYYDKNDKPNNDKHTVEVGLSEGLSNSSMLIAFITQNYLQSVWCRGELREFIFFHGLKVENPELEAFYRQYPSYKVYHKKGELPQLPVLLLLMDQTISLESISESISPEDKLQDFNYRTAAYRPDTNQSEKQFYLNYIKKRGIDASHYIKKSVSHMVYTGNKTDLAEKIITWHSNFSHLKTPKKEIINEFEEPEVLWKRICLEYPISKFAESIDIRTLLKAINPGKPHIDDLHLKISTYSNEQVISLCNDITLGHRFVSYFDRNSAENYALLPTYLHLLPKVDSTINSTKITLDKLREITNAKQLRPFIIQGHPIEILVRLAQQKKMLKELQYSYYSILKNDKRHLSIDLAIIGALYINIEMWYEVINDLETFHQLVIEPLNNYKDIQSLFLW